MLRTTLTPSGFLHEYVKSPLISLFLPPCTLGSAASSSAKSHKFRTEGWKDGSGSIKMGSIYLDHAPWTSRVEFPCPFTRYLVPSDTLECSGPVAAAVRAAGYTSEEGEEGSGVEEE